jgi:hypothetical protein
MGKAVWIVFVLGIIAVVLVMVGFLATMTLFSESPAAQRTRLALHLREKFGFEKTGVQVRLEDGQKVLRISYETFQDSKNDVLRQQQEMKDVAGAAAGQIDEKELRGIEEIRVTRVEIKGRGCWQTRQVAHETFPNPARKGVERFRFDK